VEVVAVGVHAQYLVGQDVRCDAVEEHLRAVALHDLVTLLRLGRVADLRGSRPDRPRFGFDIRSEIWISPAHASLKGDRGSAVTRHLAQEGEDK
jgi:hypothetical protein